MTILRRIGREEIWGDGFAVDDFFESAMVREWDGCSPDEYIRVFPWLARSGPLPGPLRGFLDDRIRALSEQTRLDRRVSGWTSWRLRMHTFLHWPEPTRASDGGPSWRRGLTLLADIQAEVDQRAIRAFDLAAAAEFAFWAGIHPIYVWPEAIASHEFFTAVGWLGQATRHDGAFMPRDIAEYLVSVIDDDPCGRVSDPALVPYLSSGETARAVLSVARRRLERPGMVLRLPASARLANLVAHDALLAAVDR